jgi:RsiW-degrading membrane proteinase PrsW (M82 family)
VSGEATTGAISKPAAAQLTEVWGDARSLGLKSVFPFKALISSRVLRNPSTWVMLLFGLGPLVEFSLSPGVQELVLFLVVYFATAWCAYLYVFVVKRNVSLKLGLAAAAFSLFIGYPLDLVLAKLPPLSWFYHLIGTATVPGRFAGYVLGVGVEEELIKAIPVILLAYALGRVRKPIDGIFFSALSGFGFAINESSKYIAGMHNPAGMLGQTFLRTTALPFLHATWTTVSGYFIALAVMKRRGRVAFSIFGITLAAVVHGCFDSAPDGLPTICAGLFAYLLFVSYIASVQETDDHTVASAAEQIERAAPVLPSAPKVAAGALGGQ